MSDTDVIREAFREYLKPGWTLSDPDPAFVGLAALARVEANAAKKDRALRQLLDLTERDHAGHGHTSEEWYAVRDAALAAVSDGETGT